MLYTSIFLGYSNFVFYKYGTHLASYQNYPGAHMGNVLLKKKKWILKIKFVIYSGKNTETENKCIAINVRHK